MLNPNTIFVRGVFWGLVCYQIPNGRPINPPRAAAVDTLARLFFKQESDDVLVRVQNPITLPQDSEPEPDVALVRTVEHGYKQRHPCAAEIFLVVEIGDSSARADRINKVPLYARFGVMEVWVIDLAARQVWIYADPENGQYKTVRPLPERAYFTERGSDNNSRCFDIALVVGRRAMQEKIFPDRRLDSE